MKKLILIVIVFALILPVVHADDFKIFIDHGSIMLIIDPDTGEIVFANHAASDFYGYTIEHLQTMNIKEINILSSSEVTQEMAMAKVQKRNYFNFIHLTSDDDLRNVEVYSYPVLYQDKEMLFSIIIDVTDRYKIENELRASQERERKNLISIVYVALFALFIFGVLIVLVLQSNKKLTYLSYYDPLTKVYNRSVTKNYYEKMITKNEPLKVVMIDVNNLKFINDTFGHIAGDTMIKKVARFLINYFDEKDIVSRVSGDEFVVLTRSYLSNETIEKDISRQRFLIENISFDVSAGSIETNEGVSYEKAFSKAESRMYSLKVTGRDDSIIRIRDEIMKKMYDVFPESIIKIRITKQIAQVIGERLQMTDDEVSDLITAATYQDISIGILAENEGIEKCHPEKSFSIINALGMKYSVANIVLNHHEYYDGSGFPLGLHGKDIPYSSRVLLIANDLYEKIRLSSVNAIDSMMASPKYDREILKNLNDEDFLETMDSLIKKE